MKKILASFFSFWMILGLLFPAAAEQTTQLRGYSKKDGYVYVRFGSYFTGADGARQPILWRVLRVKDGEAYLLSEYILFSGPVQGDNDHYSSWETSDLYAYLNGTFKNDAFSLAQQAALLVRTEDQAEVTLLSSDEMKDASLGFPNDKSRQCQSTAWAKILHNPPLWELPKGNKKVTWKKLNVFSGKNQYSPWWSRTRSADHPKEQRRVVEGGKIGRASAGYTNQGVRPLITLDLSKTAVLSGSGSPDAPFLLAAAGESLPAESGVSGQAAPGQAEEKAPAQAAAVSTPPPAQAGERKPMTVTQQKNENVYLIEGEDRLIARPYPFPNGDSIRMVNALNAAFDALGDQCPPVYLYFVESSRSHSIDWTFSEDSPVYTSLKQDLHATGFDHLKYSTYEGYCHYFYSTDHHWNHRGAYQGYVDIVRMMFGDDEPVLVPSGEVEINAVYNGSFAQRVKMPVSKEKFAFYTFDPFPEYTAYQYGKKRPYDHIRDIYMKGKYKTGKYANHYAQCFGGDAGLMIFESANHPERTLLLIGNSLSNGVKYLLTNHFGKIVYVDFRNYGGQAKKSFSVSAAVKQYGINSILLLGDTYLFNVGEPPVN